MVACGSDPVSVPKVAGRRLDNAHNVLKDAGFEKFDDVDGIANRTAMLDSNWVVLNQTPGADQRAKTSVTVKLEIAKPRDAGVRDRLPANSPILADLEKAAAQAIKAQAFVDKVDPQARIAKNALTDLNTLGRNTAAPGAVTAVSIVNLADIKLALGVYKSVVSDAPDMLTVPTGKLKDSIDGTSVQPPLL